VRVLIKKSPKCQKCQTLKTFIRDDNLHQEQRAGIQEQPSSLRSPAVDQMKSGQWASLLDSVFLFIYTDG